MRVLLVGDRPDELARLERLLVNPGLQLSATLAEPARVLNAIRRVQPHVVCLDLDQPARAAVRLTQGIMAEDPRAILVLVPPADGATTDASAFAALDAGAVEVVARPQAGPGGSDGDATELINKIRLASGVRVFRRRGRHISDWQAVEPDPLRRRPRIVVIGASTGGPPAIAQVLGALPASFPLPILCVQHISKGFLPGFTDWLNRHCRVRVKQADHGEVLEAGTVYLPGDETHLTLDARRRLVLSPEPPVDGHRPSVTVTMRSAARQFDGAVMGVLLTGMGRDGADGIAEIAQLGGVTIAQDEYTSAVFGMPHQAIATGAVQHVLPIENIAARLLLEAGVGA